MKQLLNHKNLPALTVIAGAVGLLLRTWQLNAVTDKGFIIRGHISGILLYVLSAAVIAALVCATRPLLQANKYTFNFPASVAGGIGALVAAFAFGLTAVIEFSLATDVLTTLSAFFGILAAISLVFVSHCRWKGLHPSTLFHVAICGYMMLRLICMYRLWSSDPQLEDYCFQLLAIVCLMLSAYHRATFDANFGRRHSYVFFNLSGVYFCCLSLAGPDSILFFLGGGAWLITDLCNLTPMPKEFQGIKEHDPS